MGETSLDPVEYFVMTKLPDSEDTKSLIAGLENARDHVDRVYYNATMFAITGKTTKIHVRGTR